MCISILSMDNRDIWHERGYQHKRLSGEWAGHRLVFCVQLQKIGALDAAYREERHTELGCPQLLNEGIAACIVHFRKAFLAGTPEVRRHAEILLESNI